MILRNEQKLNGKNKPLAVSSGTIWGFDSILCGNWVDPWEWHKKFKNHDKKNNYVYISALWRPLNESFKQIDIN